MLLMLNDVIYELFQGNINAAKGIGYIVPVNLRRE
jgi:hypothetical protein